MIFEGARNLLEITESVTRPRRRYRGRRIVDGILYVLTVGSCTALVVMVLGLL